MTIASERQTVIAGELRDVNKWYGHHHVLTEVSVRVGRGEIVALIGRSGSGKSTVLRVFAGLSTDHTGERVVSGAPALAFQEPRLFPWRDVRANVVYGLTRSRLPRSEARARADRALADVGLADRADVWPLTLSGGQAQRVSLARALVAKPTAHDPDEPNDNIEWVDGRMFSKPDLPIYSGRGKAVRFSASVDRVEDPHDVYRVKVRGHSRVHVTAKPTFGHITLRAFAPGAKSLSQRRRVVARSARPGTKTERITIRNRSRNARTFFVALDVPKGLLLNAAYTLTAKR